MNEISPLVEIIQNLSVTGVFIALWVWERNDRKYYQHKYEDLLKIMAGLNIPQIKEQLRDLGDKPVTYPNRDNAHAQDR